MYEVIIVCGYGLYAGFVRVGRVVEFCDLSQVLLEFYSGVVPERVTEEYSVITGRPKMGCGALDGGED